MTALASSDVTVTVNERNIVGKKRRARVTLAFGDGALTYPSGGVPLPTFASFGMTRNIDFVTMFDEDDASGIIWKYDRTNHKLRGYVQGYSISTTGANDTLLKVTATTGSLNTINPAAIGCADLAAVGSSGSVRTGVLQELSTAQAPAAQTMQGEAVGW